MQDDHDILELLQQPAARQEAFRMLVDRYSKMLYWKIRAIVILHEDADDVLQNTFLKVWQRIDSFKGDARLSTWLFRIAVNEAIDCVRKHESERTVPYMSLSDRLLADDYFDGSRAQALLLEAVALLPDVQRTVFSLRYFEEMSYRDISLATGTTEGALKASYHIAVKKITDYLHRHE